MGKLLVLIALGAFVYFWLKGGAQRRRLSMPAAEARDVLGLDADASIEEVREAHRRIIARVHPDAGGTPELARRTNLARDVLVAELNAIRKD
jgi:hypothetical protein